MTEYENTLEEITERYSKSLDGSNNKKKYNYISTNLIFHIAFTNRVKKTRLKEKIEELENISKSHKIKDIINIKKEIKNILDEYSQINNDEDKSYKYYDNMLIYLRLDLLKNNYIKEVENIYNDVCKSIIQSRLKYYINLERKLLKFIEKINKLSCFFD